MFQWLTAGLGHHRGVRAEALRRLFGARAKRPQLVGDRQVATGSSAREQHHSSIAAVADRGPDHRLGFMTDDRGGCRWLHRHGGLGLPPAGVEKVARGGADRPRCSA